LCLLRLYAFGKSFFTMVLSPSCLGVHKNMHRRLGVSRGEIQPCGRPSQVLSQLARLFRRMNDAAWMGIRPPHDLLGLGLRGDRPLPTLRVVCEVKQRRGGGGLLSYL
jgi:hypothetical protein